MAVTATPKTRTRKSTPFLNADKGISPGKPKAESPRSIRQRDQEARGDFRPEPGSRLRRRFPERVAPVRPQAPRGWPVPPVVLQCARERERRGWRIR